MSSTPDAKNSRIRIVGAFAGLGSGGSRSRFPMHRKHVNLVI